MPNNLHFYLENGFNCLGTHSLRDDQPLPFMMVYWKDQEGSSYTTLYSTHHTPSSKSFTLHKVGPYFMVHSYKLGLLFNQEMFQFSSQGQNWKSCKVRIGTTILDRTPRYKVSSLCNDFYKEQLITNDSFNWKTQFQTPCYAK